jgi:hypothetical protein
MNVSDAKHLKALPVSPRQKSTRGRPRRSSSVSDWSSSPVSHSPHFIDDATCRAGRASELAGQTRERNRLPVRCISLTAPLAHAGEIPHTPRRCPERPVLSNTDMSLKAPG